MKLFENGKIGNLQLKNRLVMAPMAIGGLVEPDGRISEEAISYYSTRAKGGVGLIITGLIPVDNEIESNLLNGWAAFPRIDSGVYIPRLSKLADNLHDYDAKLAIQLTAGFGRVAPHFLFRQGKPPAPSPLECYWNSNITTRELNSIEISKLIKAFSRAARIAKAAGVDAIELHGHEGYLLDQFKTKLWNRRMDSYGGDLYGRLRFSKEVIEAIKSATSDEFPIIYRFGLTHYIEGGRESEEGLEIAKFLQEFGVDALHVDAGCYETWYWAHPPLYQMPGCMVDMAAAAKKVVSIPVIAVGRLGYPNLAEQVLNEKKADFIAIGRSLLADPEWPDKVRYGKLDDIRPCIGDHDGCLGRTFKGKPLSCSVNPAVGLEDELILLPAQIPLRVLVIGGGPAGMEAARASAIRGHSVTLLEKEDKLGGNLIPGSVPWFKKDINLLVQYYSRQLVKLGVSIKLRQAATTDLVQKYAPEVVIVATGSEPILPDWITCDQKNVIPAIDLLRKKPKIHSTQKVIVVGGGYVGCETAVYLAEQCVSVKVIELLPQILKGVFPANRDCLIKMMEKRKVSFSTEKKLTAVQENCIVIQDKNGSQEKMNCDLVVLALGLRPKCELKKALEPKVPRIYAIGDCVAPRGIFDAIREGYRLARMI